MIDFCYFVNVATAIYLLWFPQHTGLEALVYALSDGPLAGALVAWQCPWVFGSEEHTTRWALQHQQQQDDNDHACDWVCHTASSTGGDSTQVGCVLLL